MGQQKPTLDEFKENIETLFGQQLTGPATIAAEDFWNNWDFFDALISARSLAVHVDTLQLSQNFPKYERYHKWKGAGIATFIVGIISLFFSWKIGVVVTIFGAGFYCWGGRARFNDAKDFAEKLMKEATLNPAKGGYAGLCANYIAGIIQIVSPVGSAHWPQYPSNVISGERTLISNPDHACKQIE